jgi:hypothetical protein
VFAAWFLITLDADIMTEPYCGLPQFLQAISVYRERETAAYVISFLVVLPVD